MKETREFVNSAFDTAVQGLDSFKDGVQVQDIADFFDEATGWPAAINGLVQGFPAEAKLATPEDVETLFEPQRNKLVGAGVHPMLAGSIVTNIKGIYYTYATILQTGQKVVDENKA